MEDTKNQLMPAAQDDHAHLDMHSLHQDPELFHHIISGITFNLIYTSKMFFTAVRRRLELVGLKPFQRLQTKQVEQVDLILANANMNQTGLTESMQQLALVLTSVSAGSVQWQWQLLTADSSVDNNASCCILWI